MGIVKTKKYVMADRINYREKPMKKYLFGLGAMLVGAGLMFVLMHGEVKAEGDAGKDSNPMSSWSKTDFLCHKQSKSVWSAAGYSLERNIQIPEGYGPAGDYGDILECKKGNTTCYIVFGGEGSGGISCFKEGLFK